LADIDCTSDWHYCHAAKKNPTIIKRMTREPVKPLIEIRTLTLRPGTRPEFQRIYVEEALPRLKRWDFDVVAHGPSLHDENTYYVIRRYDSLAQRQEMEDAYYSSDDWRQGPREAMLALIENYTDIVFELEEVTVQGLRK
jgi:NIPSNAP